MSNQSQNNENQPIYVDNPEKIHDFAEEMLTAITIKLQKEGWTLMTMKQFLNMTSPRGFQMEPIDILEIHIHEIDELYVLYHAEKDFVCVGTNISQIVARAVFGRRKAIYVKFNRLIEKREHSIKVGNRNSDNYMTYTLDPDAIELFEVDLSKINPVDHRHPKRKIEEDINLPYKLHIKFCNNQSDSDSANDRLQSQEAIFEQYNEKLDKFLFTTQEPSISTFNEDIQTSVDMTHEVILDIIINSVYDLKRLYCQMFENLRLCFVRAEDVHVSKKEALYMINEVNYCLACYRYGEERYIISTSKNEYRQKMKNFIAGEHIKYGLEDGTGEANVTPDGLYYRVGTFDTVTTPKVENFVTEELTFNNRVLILKDPSDPLRSYRGHQTRLGVEFGSSSLKVVDLFGNNRTRRSKALIKTHPFEFNQFGYADCDDALNLLLESDDAYRKNVLNNIDRSKSEELCEEALYKNEIFALREWVIDNWAYVEAQTLNDLYISGAPDCLAKMLIDSNAKKYEQDIVELKKCFREKDSDSLASILNNISAKLNDDFDNLECYSTTPFSITNELFEKIMKYAKPEYKIENSTFDKTDWLYYVKFYLMVHLIYKDLNTFYDVFRALDLKLLEVFGFNSRSKLEDYRTTFGDNKRKIIETMDSIQKLFSFEKNFEKNEGNEKLFVMLTKNDYKFKA